VILFHGRTGGRRRAKSMGMKKYKEMKEKKKPKQPRSPFLAIGAAFVVIVIVVGVIEFYPRPVLSNTVYCGVFEYIAFPAISIAGKSTYTVNETITTGISFTTSTNVSAHIGHVWSTVTTTNHVSGGNESAGAATICKYISNVSLPAVASTSSSSSSSSSVTSTNST
jgi:hypothetical protein